MHFLTSWRFLPLCEKLVLCTKSDNSLRRLFYLNIFTTSYPLGFLTKAFIWVNCYNFIAITGNHYSTYWHLIAAIDEMCRELSVLFLRDSRTIFVVLRVPIYALLWQQFITISTVISVNKFHNSINNGWRLYH